MDEVTQPGGGQAGEPEGQGNEGLAGRFMSLARRFMNLFAGLDRAHGTYKVTSPRGDGKQTGEAVTKREPVTVELWERHLAGEQRLGVVPVHDDATALFGAIDVDTYRDFDPAKVAERVRALGLPLVTCRSKSGGAHLYLFMREPALAADVVKKLSEMKAVLGFAESEVFPKQSRLDAKQGQIGSWINMPYFGGSKGLCYALKPDGNAFEPEEFLDSAEASRVEPGYLTTPLRVTEERGDFADGPPCLAHLAVAKITEYRNNALYNIAVYAKMACEDDWKAFVERANREHFPQPLASGEVMDIIKQAEKKEYRYKCGDQPIVRHCDRALCRTRRYGVGAMGVSLPVFGQLTQFDTDPPTYVWEVEGKQLYLSPQELFNFPQFNLKYMTKCRSIITPQMKNDRWRSAFVNPALSKVHVEEMPDDASPEGMLWTLLEQFCTGRAQAKTKDGLLSHRPWTDDDGRTWFRLPDLRLFLERKHFNDITGNQRIAAVLKRRGAVMRDWRIKGVKIDVWGVPKFSVPNEPLDIPPGIASGPPF